MRIGALFAGYGGLEHGVQAVLGGDVAWYSEIDKGALKILTHRYPDTPNIGDVTTVDWAQVEPVDVLTGGSPCQDLSHAGKRAGMTEGTRSNLWVAMREAIAQLRPGLVVWENVRGAYSADADSALEHCPGCMGDGRPGTVLRALGRVVGDLADLGYMGGVHGLRAADVGAPHGRFRVFAVAYPQGDTGRLAHGDGSVAADADERRRGATRRDHGVRAARLEPGHRPLLPTPATSDTNGAGHHGDGGLDLRTAGSLLPTPSSADGLGGHERRSGARGDELLLNGVAKELGRLLPTPTTEPNTGNGHARNLGGETRLLPTPMVGSTNPAAHGQISGQWRDQMAEALAQWGAYADAIARWEHILGRPAPPPTMTSSKGNPQLSPAFVEWMMGLPAGWVTDTPHITRNEALKALGNGVVPLQAGAALRVLLDVLAVSA